MTFFNPTDEFVDKLVEVINNRMVVEIGCGEGELMMELIQRNVKIIGIDPYVDTSDLSITRKIKILHYELDEGFDFCSTLIKNLNGNVVFLVARPCHSKFTQEYLNMFGHKSEMIYIGFAKNLEIDFERDISLVEILDFPEHPDCDIVVSLKDGEWEDNMKKEQDWAKIDDIVRKSKEVINPELIEWVKGLRLDSHKLISKVLKEKGIECKSSHMGSNWGDYEGPLLGELIGFRRAIMIYRNTSIEWINELENKEFIEHTSFISFSRDKNSGGQDEFGDVCLEIDEDELFKQGAIEVWYDKDFMENYPDICKHITGYTGEKDFLKQNANENGEVGECELDWNMIIESYEHEEEIVIKKLQFVKDKMTYKKVNKDENGNQFTIWDNYLRR